MKRIVPLVFALALAGVLFSRSHNTFSHHLHGLEEFESSARLDAWENLRLRDPRTGQIPDHIRTRELAFAQRLSSQRISQLQGAAVSMGPWKSAGPFNTGGRTQALGIDVLNESIVLAATAEGGIWRSSDAGASWKRVCNPGQARNCMSLVQDHRAGKSATWYCGTGELLSTTDRKVSLVGAPRWRTLGVGDGILKSTDNGVSWQLLPSTHDETESTLDSAFDGVWNIAVDNSNTAQDILYAATYGAIMRSTDGGATWVKVLGDAAAKSFCTDVAVTSAGVLYAYMGSTAAGTSTAGYGVWRSTDGIHWVNITPANWPARAVRMRLAISPSNENIVYIAGETPGVLSVDHSLWKYTYSSGTGEGNGGLWSNRTTNLPGNSNSLENLNTLGSYALTLRVHPSNSDVVFLGGTNLYRSTDGFATSANVQWIGGYNPDPNGGQSYPNHHPDMHDVQFSNDVPNRMYNSNDAGVFRTEDCLADDGSANPVQWENLNNGLTASLVYVTGVDHATQFDETLIGGFQDQGTWIGDPTSDWNTFYGGDGGYCAIADGGRDFYMTAQFGQVARMRIDNTGSITGFGYVFPTDIGDPQFVTPYLLDPTDSKRMYFSAGHWIMRNEDLDQIPGDNSTATDVGWARLTHSLQPDSVWISALGCASDQNHAFYYGTSNGHVYRMDAANAGNPSPQDVTSPIFPANAFVSCVTVDPANADNVIVCFSNYHVRSIFASSDAGGTWHDISGNLEENADGSGDGPSVRWASIVHQGNSALYLIATSAGLYSTSEIGTSSVEWAQEGPETIGNVIVEHIDARQSDGFTAIATQGSGVLCSYATAQGGTVLPPQRQQSDWLYPTLVHDKLQVSCTEVNMAIKIVSLTGRIVQQTTSGSSSGGELCLDLHALPSGEYFVRRETPAATETRKILIQH